MVGGDKQGATSRCSPPPQLESMSRSLSRPLGKRSEMSRESMRTSELTFDYSSWHLVRGVELVIDLLGNFRKS